MREAPEQVTTSPSPSASERAEELVANWKAERSVPWTEIAEHIAAEITAAETAAEARGAERMRERCKAEAHTWNAPLSFVNALAALPLETEE